MANCDPFVIWRNVPTGAKLTASATGDTTKFDLVIRILGDDGTITRWERSQLVPGPASMTLPIPHACSVTATFSIFNKTNVTLNLTIDDAAHSCSWTFSNVGGHQVKVEILP